MEITVFKFGGASINGAEGVVNLGEVLKLYPETHIVLVISAMGKTTNALEELLTFYLSGSLSQTEKAFGKVREYHDTILQHLFPNLQHPVFAAVEALFTDLRHALGKSQEYSATQPLSYGFEYDRIVSYGEMISSTIVCHYLESKGSGTCLFDARKLVATDSSFRDATVDWDTTQKRIREQLLPYFEGSKQQKVAITQGFIGGDAKGNTTTLGREGSDYTAAIFAYSLGIKELTIWKDVPGVMNADPKWHPDVRKIDLLSYREAIELAYYGASVIHPKTIKPLENANIKLNVKSFNNPTEPGTTIENLSQWNISVPFYIRKLDQALISISPRDFSFIVEENLSQIFRIFAHHRIKVNVMQNSAISFTVCVDNHRSLNELVTELQERYAVRYNRGVELYTIRHYTEEAIKRVTANKKVLMEQKTRNTVHLIVIPE
jgi:aspartate kinase